VGSRGLGTYSRRGHAIADAKHYYRYERYFDMLHSQVLTGEELYGSKIRNEKSDILCQPSLACLVQKIALSTLLDKLCYAPLVYDHQNIRTGIEHR